MDINLPIGIENGKKIEISAQELVTGRTCVIAQSGAGKSYAIAVLCEQLLKNGIAFCIIDTEGEYFSLKEKFNILWVGKEGSDVDIDTVDFKQLTEKMLKENIPVILDVSDIINEREIVENFVKNLFQAGTELRRPYLLIIEEADKFVPQSKDSIKEIEEISRRGRKRGLGLLLASQRPALINKNVLSQCNNQLIGKLTTENDLASVNLFFESRRELEELTKLFPGEFFIMGSISKEKKKIKVIQRETQHKGLTPSLIKKPIGKISDFATKISAVESKEHHNAFKEISKMELKSALDKALKKKFVLFGDKEKVLSINEKHEPLHFIKISAKRNFLNKLLDKEKYYSFIIDDEGNFASIGNFLFKEKGFNAYIGLNQRELKVFFEIIKEKGGISVAELEVKTKFSDTNLRNILKKLRDKKLITDKSVGNAKLYLPISYAKIPNIKREEPFPQLEKIVKPVESKLSKDDIREIIKAIDENSEILEFKTFYYPIFEVRTEKRIIKIDGVTGSIL